MALLFSAASHRVDVGSAASLDGLATGTFAAWIYLNSGKGDSAVFGKIGVPDADGTLMVVTDSGAGLYFELIRATTSLRIITSSIIGLSAWYFVAATWATSGTDSDQHLYAGSLSNAVAEAGSYSTRRVGSGTPIPGDTANLYIGNYVDLAAWSYFDGRIATAGIWNIQLSLSELDDQRRRPRVTTGCQGFWNLGYNGTGTQFDESGNGNNGTVTGATQASHPPIISYPVLRRGAWRRNR